MKGFIKYNKIYKIARLFLIIFSFVFFFSFFFKSNSYAETNSLIIEDATIIDKSSSVAGNITNFNGYEITSDVTFYKIDDFVTYKFVIKNVSDNDISIISIEDDNDNEYLTYEYEKHENDTIESGSTLDLIVKISYKYGLNDISKRDQNNNVKLKINYKENNEESFIIINPITGDNININLTILIISSIGLIICIIIRITRKRKNNKLLLLFVTTSLLMTAIIVKASTEKIVIQIESSYGLYDNLIVKYMYNDEERTLINKYGDAINNLEAAFIDGYTFDNWTLEDGSIFDLSTPITSDIKLIPKYSLTPYEITYDLNDGTLGDETNPTTYTMLTETFTLNNPSKTGYEFKGWSGTDLIGDENILVTITKGTKKALSYTANYTPNKYTIKFDKNGTDVDGNMDPQELYYDTSSALNNNAYTRDFYTFDSWNTKADGTGTKYNNGDPIINLITEGEITLYAQWNSTFQVVFSHSGACTFNGNNGLITGDECSEFHDVGLINTGIELFNEENYNKDFEISFNIDHYSASEQESISSNQPTILNTKFEVSSNSTTPVPGYVLRNKKSSNSVYEFTGVNPKNNNRFAKDIPITDVNKFSLRRVSGKMYYSINDEAYISMEHDITDDNALRFDVPLTIGGSLNAELDESTGNYVYTPFRIIKGTLSNIVVKLGAINTNEIAEVKLNGNGGNSYVLNYNVGDTIGTIADSSRSGYIFTGWYTGKNDGDLVVNDTVVTENVTYYAHWVKSAKLLSFEKETFTLDVGETAQLVPTNADTIAETWTYSSGRTQTATVNQNGLITAQGIGKTYIRVKGNTSGQYKDITVIVRGSVYDMTFNENPITVILGNEYDVKANISNALDIKEEYTFASNDKSIFTIDSETGIITPVKVGNKKLKITGKTSGVTIEVPVNIVNSN